VEERKLLSGVRKSVDAYPLNETEAKRDKFGVAYVFSRDTMASDRAKVRKFKSPFGADNELAQVKAIVLCNLVSFAHSCFAVLCSPWQPIM
jgi:hypothetical protein